MDFLRSIAIAASGLRAQAGRMRIIAENIANADSTAPKPGSEPYRRKIASFTSEIDRALEARTVGLGRIKTDPSAFRLKYEPGHPAADLREAQRSYEANVNVITASRRMILRTIEILKS
jgi:flagellar basal-body rod protein FlgC